MKTKPKLPKGYRWLKVGDKRPQGYRFRGLICKGWSNGGSIAIGCAISKESYEFYGPYIAPIRKRRKKQ